MRDDVAAWSRHSQELRDQRDRAVEALRFVGEDIAAALDNRLLWRDILTDAKHRAERALAQIDQPEECEPYADYTDDGYVAACYGCGWRSGHLHPLGSEGKEAARSEARKHQPLGRARPDASTTDRERAPQVGSSGSSKSDTEDR